MSTDRMGVTGSGETAVEEEPQSAARLPTFVPGDWNPEPE